MTKRIFRSILTAALIVFLVSMTMIMGVLYNYFSQVQRQQLRLETALAAQGVALNGEAYFQNLDTGNCRMTWIDREGNVLYDNKVEITTLPNHLDREEIAQALQTGYGESFRHSDTLMERTIYTAQLLPDGTVLRLSSVHSSPLNLILEMLPATAVVFLLISALALLLAFRLSRRIADPLNRLNLDLPMSNKEYDELTPLLQRIDSQQRQLQLHQAELLRKQNEFDTVTADMQEGLVLLNNKGIILSINKAASQLLGIPFPTSGEDIMVLGRTPEMRALILDALSGRRSEQTVTLPSGSYQVDASPVFSDGCLSGVALLMLDVTEKHKAELLRREFTANVSHELKIPLQSISGYAELMANGIVKPEDVKPFSEKIYQEAQHLIGLVADIIRLSRLDEGAADMQRESVPLYALASETLTELASKAKQADVTVSLTGSEVAVSGIRQLLSSVVHNLCDNAIKYNRKGGSITVTVSDEGEYACLCIQDTGIGIPAADLDRIFERFYRVDKSHSKNIEGTGLGLSIVKHAVLIHGGKIHVESAPGQGTSICVNLPK